MRRWNGWGHTSQLYPLPENAKGWLADEIGAAQPIPDAARDTVLASVPVSRLSEGPAWLITDPAERLDHARGQSLPDWVALRHGRIERFPDAVAYPETEEDITAIYRYAEGVGAAIIPYGGGTSVVGGINAQPDDPPVITVDLSRMNTLHHLDETSRMARFGAGVRGPHLEAALRAQGYMLGHFPQSFELSTLGGWIVTRSSGQQSLHYGRVEHFFLGGRMVTPVGGIDMLPHPASAAGPDIREVVMGSEGRMGILTDATIRITPLPEAEAFHGIFFPDWASGVEATRTLAQSGLALSMLRLSNGAETEANLNLAGHERLVNFAHTGLGVIGQERREKCLLIVGITGADKHVRRTRADVLSITRSYGGFHTGQYIGRTWAHSRFLTPYLRNTLWEHGYAIDTLETLVSWSEVPAASADIQQAIRDGMAANGERGFVMAHLSHVYPTSCSIYTTYMFHVKDDPDRQIAEWHRLKDAASRAIIEHGGTITHQHAIGTDHAPYLEAEKGALTLSLIDGVFKNTDPNGMMNPGKLIPGHRQEKQLS